LHPEYNEGSRAEILPGVYPEPFDNAQARLGRRAQNDKADWARRTVYECHGFRFSDRQQA